MNMMETNTPLLTQLYTNFYRRHASIDSLCYSVEGMDDEDYPIPEELYETLEEEYINLREIEDRITHILKMNRVFNDILSISLGPLPPSVVLALNP